MTKNFIGPTSSLIFIIFLHPLVLAGGGQLLLNDSVDFPSTNTIISRPRLEVPKIVENTSMQEFNILTTEEEFKRREPALAATLSILFVPGAGHFYNRQYLKGTIYSVSQVIAWFLLFGHVTGDIAEIYAYAPLFNKGIASFDALVSANKINKAHGVSLSIEIDRMDLLTKDQQVPLIGPRIAFNF